MNDSTILLVDDNPDDIELTLHAFRINRITNTVIVREDGQQAVEYLLDDATPLPALILLDINLPKLSGLEVLKAVRNNPRTSLVPVVVLTTSRDEGDMTRTYTAGANSFIVKPVDFAHFSDAIRQLGMYWLMLNQAPPQKERANAEAVTTAAR